MGSIDTPKPTPIAAQLPTINLDTTLAELYRRASPKNADRKLGLVLCGVTSSTSAPTSRTTPSTRTRTGRSNNRALQKSLATKYLSLIPQRDAFIAGPGAPVVLFHQGRTEAKRARDRREAEATVAVLSTEQRPELVFCASPASIPLGAKHGIARIAYKVVLDGLARYPLTHPLGAHWFLNSKAALARSGLPTPRTRIVEIEGHGGTTGSSCCERCAAVETDMRFIPAGCTGGRGRWLEAQAARVVEAVERQPVPFVLKTQQTFGGAGTWVVRSEQQKQDLLRDLWRRRQGEAAGQEDESENDNGDDDDRDDDRDDGILRRLLSQQKLKDKFAPLVQRAAAWVAHHGYYGPVGIDVLETRMAGATASATAEPTAHHVVDLNACTSGSLALPLLRGHFIERGLQCAGSFSVAVDGGRRDFIEAWRPELEAGRMLIPSWYEDGEAGESLADIVVGGEDERDLQRRMKRVREATREVTF
ncbi:hypothetical protein B0T26DRAFT_775581 [Lasiosphaeria miniovina]|uniref:Uncharacterized protein n=1 Tax=Lasiosphaeria miniovina TaxID=1954250 RepID=A0AA40AK96_9PEZI|nr:uncharacterized protein B0T26DRAFT_775581 [Lasiosphaeria miniovina]KAK0717330.1 hypothetical protein B0T26DRAFT_775581 [Lasiosphaeria miniovina]